MSMNPRLLERRRAVAEDNAKRNVGRLLRFLIAVAVLSGLVWLAFSPWLSVRQVRTSGVFSSDTNAILAENRVIAGTPMVIIRPGLVEEALRSDPWVSRARVHMAWPDEVVVQVEERTPAAWVETGAGWTWRAVDGVALPSPGSPDDTLPRVRLPGIAEPRAATSVEVLGALEFVTNLPRQHSATTTVWMESSEMWATVADYEIRLGRPVDMRAKALALAALLAKPIPDGSTLVLIAPTHPAVRPPRTGDDTAGETDLAGDGETGEETGATTLNIY